MSRVSQYFGQKDPNVQLGNPYVSAPVSGSLNNPIALNQYYQLANQNIPSSKAQYGVRRMMKWMVPERGIVEMYINPQNIVITKKKQITSKRTKGGFIIQYWGEELLDISITGHTGTSGIEGINVLDDIYRGEQIAFDIIALEEATKLKNEEEQFISVALPGLSDVMDSLKLYGEEPKTGGMAGLSIPRPTLGYYAASIEMYWMGEVYRGFFNSFTVTEGVDMLGIFRYDIKFTATQRRGIRRNYLAWHKTPTAGPSNHDTIPFTYQTNALPVSNGSRKREKLRSAEAAKEAMSLVR